MMIAVQEARTLISAHTAALPVEWTPLLEAQGRVMARGGQMLTPSRIALLASQGKGHAMVHAPARIGILTPTDAPNPAVLAVTALVAEAGGIPVRLPVTPDSASLATRALQQALHFDVLILMNWRFDGLWKVLGELGTVHFRSIAQDPGGDLGFATAMGRPIFILSDDLPATCLNFEVYIRPALRRMLGHQAQERPRVIAVAQDAYDRVSGRVAFLPARIDKKGLGYVSRLVSPEGPANAEALASANGYVILPSSREGFAAGDNVEAMLLEPQEICQMACLPIGGDTAVTRARAK